MKLYLNCLDNEVTFNKKNYLLRAAQRLGIEGQVVPLLNSSLDRDYVLNIEPYDLVIGNKWTGIWEIDLLCDRQEMSESNWGFANKVFLADAVIPKRLEKLAHKTSVLFQACDPELYQQTVKPEYDFVFIGTSGGGVYQKRADAIELLKKDFSYQSFEKNQRPENYIKTISLARVQFIRSMYSDIADGEIAQRFFECLAIGPVLTNRVPDLKLTGLIEGEDYLAYDNDEEMVTNMRRLIDDEELRKTIAKNGREKALLHHTYENRLVSILNAIKYG